MMMVQIEKKKPKSCSYDLMTLVHFFNKFISHDKVIHKVIVWIHPLFQWYPQSKEILLNLSLKRWNSAFNAQGSRLIIVIVQVRAVKIYVLAVEALRKKERGDETQFTTQNWWKNYFVSQLFSFVKFHSQLYIWCPIMPAILAP
jgi:hypothetical protein